MKSISILVISLFLASCGAVLTVDYDTEKDFSDYNAYQFYDDIDSGLNQLDDKRIKAAIDNSFQKRGFTKTDYCRFYVNFMQVNILQHHETHLE